MRCPTINKCWLLDGRPTTALFPSMASSMMPYLWTTQCSPISTQLRCVKVLEPKVDGTKSLNEAFWNDDLDCFNLAPSVAASETLSECASCESRQGFSWCCGDTILFLENPGHDVTPLTILGGASVADLSRLVAEGILDVRSQSEEHDNEDS